jgi:hypothetical protein
VKRWLTCCAGATAVALMAAALLLLVGIPALVGYLAGYDRQPLFDIQGIGQRHTIGAYDVILIAVSEADCSTSDTCQQVNITFEIVRPDEEAGSGRSYSVSLQAGASSSDLTTLEDGTALRVITVRHVPLTQADEPAQSVRFQAFLPLSSDK